MLSPSHRILTLLGLSIFSVNAAVIRPRFQGSPTFTGPVQIRSESDTRAGWIAPQIGGGSGVSLEDFSTFNAFPEDSFFTITLSGGTYTIAPLAASGSFVVLTGTSGNLTVSTDTQGSTWYIQCYSAAGTNSGTDCLIQSASSTGSCATLSSDTAGVGVIGTEDCSATINPYWSFNANASATSFASSSTPLSISSASSPSLTSSSSPITTETGAIGGTTSASTPVSTLGSSAGYSGVGDNGSSSAGAGSGNSVSTSAVIGGTRTSHVPTNSTSTSSGSPSTSATKTPSSANSLRHLSGTLGAVALAVVALAY